MDALLLKVRYIHKDLILSWSDIISFGYLFYGFSLLHIELTEEITQYVFKSVVQVHTETMFCKGEKEKDRYVITQAEKFKLTFLTYRLSL